MERHVNPEDLDLSALGALEGEEQQALEAHVQTCAACAQALTLARRRMAVLGLAAPEATPAPWVREALLRRVRAERAVRPVAPPRPRRFAWLTPALAVATLVFAALDGWLWSRNIAAARQIDGLQSQLALAQTQSREIAHVSADADEMLGAPGTMHVALAQQPGEPQGRAGVLYNAHMGMAMCVGQLPPPPAGKTYQLWLVPMQGKPMSLGVYSGSERTMEMMAHVAPGTAAKAFAFTVEPLGGMPQPTGPKVLVGAAG